MHHRTSPLHKWRAFLTWHSSGERLPFIARPGHKSEGHDVVSLPSSRTNKGVFPRHIIHDVSRDTPNGSASDGSHRVRYHYFNFTAEPPRIYLGARLMSLGIVPESASAKIGDRNVRARSRLCTHELLINGIRVDRSASLAQTLDDIVRSSKLDVSGLNIPLELHLRPRICIQNIPRFQTFLSVSGSFDEFGDNFLFINISSDFKFSPFQLYCNSVKTI